MINFYLFRLINQTTLTYFDKLDFGRIIVCNFDSLINTSFDGNLESNLVNLSMKREYIEKQTYSGGINSKCKPHGKGTIV